MRKDLGYEGGKGLFLVGKIQKNKTKIHSIINARGTKIRIGLDRPVISNKKDFMISSVLDTASHKIAQYNLKGM